MEAKELMIGDWCAYGVNCKGRVTALTEHLITLSVDGDEINGLYMLMPDMVRPIPLTEEILEKNSDFTVRGEYVISGKHHNPYLRIAWSRDKEKFYFSTLGSNCYLDYVHQLQHLLRLCNIDKEISI